MGSLTVGGPGVGCCLGQRRPELPAAMASRCGGARAVLLLGITLGAAVAQDSGCPSEVAARRVNDVMQACCPDGGRHRRAQAGGSPTCDLPEACPNEECAVTFITLMDDCQDWLQQNWPPDQMAQFHRFRDRCEPLDPCSGSGLTLVDSGEVAHRDLDNGQDCRWSLSCTNNALSPRLHFTSFSTEANYDFVNLFDSATASGSAAETLHGNAVPRDWVATSSVAVVQYTSDGSVLRDGFGAQFDCVNAQSVPPPPPPRTPVTPAWDDWGWGMQPQGEPANECDACLTDCTLLGTDIAIGRPFVVEGASVMASAVEACAGSDWMVDI